MRSSWLTRIGPQSNDKRPYRRPKRRETDTGEAACNGGRDWGDAATTQGRLKLQKLGLEPQGEHSPRHLDLRPLPPKGRKDVSVVLSCPVGAGCYAVTAHSTHAAPQSHGWASWEQPHGTGLLQPLCQP